MSDLPVAKCTVKAYEFFCPSCGAYMVSSSVYGTETCGYCQTEFTLEFTEVLP